MKEEMQVNVRVHEATVIFTLIQEGQEPISHSIKSTMLEEPHR